MVADAFNLKTQEAEAGYEFQISLVYIRSFESVKAMQHKIGTSTHMQAKYSYTQNKIKEMFTQKSEKTTNLLEKCVKETVNGAV